LHPPSASYRRHLAFNGITVSRRGRARYEVRGAKCERRTEIWRPFEMVRANGSRRSRACGNLHEQLELPQIVPYRPDEEALDAGVAVGAEAVSALLAGADEDAVLQLLGRAADER